jgi:hypothetical protein
MVILGLGLPTVAARIFGAPRGRDLPSRTITRPTPSAKAVTSNSDAKPTPVEKARSAIERFETRSPVPVSVPTLPPDVTVGRFGGFSAGSIGPGQPFVSLRFEWPGHGSVELEAGHVDLMGCDAWLRKTTRTTVGRSPAVIGLGYSGRRTILWPATSFHDTGRYAITGGFSAAEIRALAVQMVRPGPAEAVSRDASGC